MRWRIAGQGYVRSAAAAAGSVATTGMMPPAAAAGTQPNVISTSPGVVSGTREETPSFDVPASIDAIDSDVIRNTHPTGAPALLQRLPGAVVQDRGSYAQDVQISSRGFGARATFGLRGVRVTVDGIPATMPDGQGSIGAFDLASARRIEFLRGPFSALYGNLSGGSFGTFRGGVGYWQSKVYVDDANSEFADGYALANWRAGFTQKRGAWTLSEFARIDNLFDRDYVAAVIVGDVNGRFYAPGPGRSRLVGVSASYRFQMGPGIRDRRLENNAACLARRKLCLVSNLKSPIPIGAGGNECIDI